MKRRITKYCNEVRDLLIEKNNAYGNSALKPAGIFGSGDAVESLGARLDDKLMRIKNRGVNGDTEDTLKDLIGYLVLLKLANDDKETKRKFVEDMTEV